MALYAIGDLHLSLGTGKTMDHMGRVWHDHPRKIRDNWEELVRPNDTVVLAGDLFMGKNLEECRQDFLFLEKLPGRKILVRGNHDLFWDPADTEKLNERFEKRFFFLQNNFAVYREYALIGSTGYAYEGRDSWECCQEKMLREILSLQISFQKALERGFRKFIMFLHYPPTSIGEQAGLFTKMAEYYRVSQVIYAHCHGVDRFDDSFHGTVNGVEYHLVSGDYLHFRPRLIAE